MESRFVKQSRLLIKNTIKQAKKDLVKHTNLSEEQADSFINDLATKLITETHNIHRIMINNIRRVEIK